ncbi:MAG: hypothetical protein HOI53_00670 [Francisellaceae bacterium]|nr:hypothetical protein [Francisellaceae bacterium]MBT6539400.1 hypothetical protein [Francisellaceae bacterium]
MINLLILQENNPNDLLNKIQSLEERNISLLGIFLQFDGTNVLSSEQPQLQNLFSQNNFVYACSSSIDKRNLPTHANVKKCSLGSLHELCEQAENIDVIGNLP